MGMKVTSTITSLGTQPGGTSHGSEKGADSAEAVVIPEATRPIKPRRDYGRGLPPAGPPNWLYTTPSIFTLFDLIKSKQSE